jgi:hypothetical protein
VSIRFITEADPPESDVRNGAFEAGCCCVHGGFEMVIGKASIPGEAWLKAA